MDQRIEQIKQKIELLSVNKLNNYLDDEINNALIASSKLASNIHIPFYDDGSPEKIFSDRLVYFRNITRKFDLSICECKDELKNNINKVEGVEKDVRENEEKIISLFSEFSVVVKNILKILSDGKPIPYLYKEPLKKLEIALDNKEEISYQDINDIIRSINYQPRFISRFNSKVFVIEGKFEAYLNLKEKLQSVFLECNIVEKIINKLIERINDLNNENSIIKRKMVGWRVAAVECFGVQYSHEQLTTNALEFTDE
ncbi:hypothetical protein F6Q07_00485 [Pectobacterium parmentieri]|uniref:hypothetical protein n=1 Tax=Pectobacterium parmentieri TaxID=1905730 RepID=UPI000EB53B28|nr:hypothetical protein [Pectobacterium parmentieri]AYH01143.1 hypothetical protein C5E26_09480 [Pectobacterium parmentieri]AYH27414.1 hypothetical protein C5E20_09885 [Pectobacterium parmentieri]AYH31719.1 hypothetical protein C5E19_08915 [Pectobacterium parmentieri]MBI0516626.1 hypothetical protein [Pectobacterium parmentieri]